MSNAPESPWSGIDISDVPTEDALEVNTSPDAIPNEAIDRTDFAEDGTLQDVPGEEPEEDPDAWRNVRISDSPGDNYALITQLADRPGFKRALHTYAANTVRKETQSQIDAAMARAEEAEHKMRIAQKAYGDTIYGSMAPEKLAQVIMNDTGRKGWERWKQLSEQVSQPQQQVPEHVRSMHNDVTEMINEASVHLSEEEVTELRRRVINPTNYAKYQNNPQKLIRELDNWLDSRINGQNNNGVQPAAMSNAAPAQRAEQALTPVVRGNSRVSQAPDSSPRSGNNGRFAKTYGPSAQANMDPDEFERILAAHNATSSLELRRAGVFVDRD